MRTLLFVALLLSSPALAQSAKVKKHFKAAIGLYENLEYEKALRQLSNADQSKDKGPYDDAKISLLRGVIFADMGREEKALAAFKTGFSIDSEASLPLDVSPKVSALAEKARASVRKMLASSVEAQKADEKRQQEEEQPSVEKKEELSAPPLLELRPNRVEERAPVAVVPPPPQGPSVRALSWIPGVVGLAAGGVGAGMLISASSKYNALNNGTAPVDKAATYRDTGPREATIGYVMVGVAAAGLGTAVTMFLLGEPGKTQVTAAPLAGGGLVFLTAQFD